MVGCGIESDFLIDIPRLPSSDISLNVWSSEERIYLQEGWWNTLPSTNAEEHILLVDVIVSFQW